MSKSYLMSITIHLGLFVCALFVTAPMIENKPTEVEIELVDTGTAMSEPAPADSAPASLMSEAQAQVQPVPAEEIQASAPAEVPIAEEVVVPAAPAVKSLPKKAVAKKAAPKAKVQLASRAVVPETLDDIEASDLNYDAVEVPVANTFNENELDEDFDQINQANTQQVIAHKSELDNQLQSLQQDMDQELSNLENERIKKEQARAEALEAARIENAKRLAQIRAGEEAAAKEAALKAARAQAAQQRAAEIAAGNAARAQAEAAARAARAGSNSDGAGSSPYASGQGTVRSVENLKQRPGNPKPSYSVDERFRREQGTVIYHAFVTSAGTLQDFKLVQSTGHRNLDEKTLAALRRWKFYPGQQGWVEIPQTWNLTGEAEEMPATLRRSLTQN